MRVMVLVKATEETERGVLPTTEEFAEMGAYNEQLINAGIMLAGDGLKPTVHGKRVRFDADAKTVLDGPFTETKELVAGYWLWEVASMDEAVEWLKRAPFRDSEVELRKILDMDDFGDFAAEITAAEERSRAETAAARS